MHIAQDKGKDLIAALQHGDEAAFKTLYETYWSDVYTMVFRRIKDEEAAKDIVQNIFVNLWTSRKTIFIENSLMQYLTAAARFRSITYYKRNLAAMNVMPVFSSIIP